MAEPAGVIDFEVYQRLNALQADVEEFKRSMSAGNDGGIRNEPGNLLDHKIALSEMRSEAKVIRLEGKLDLLAQSIGSLSSKIDAQRAEASSNKNVVIGTIVAAALSIVALLYTMISYGASTFYNGTVIRDIVHDELLVKRTGDVPLTSTTPAH